MPQTLFAILSIIVITTASLTISGIQHRSQQATIKREVEEMAGSVAIEVMEIIRTRTYDQAVINKSTIGESTDLSLFTFSGATDHFPTGMACSVFGTGTDNCDDVDDFHKMKTADYTFDIGTGKVHFDVNIEVAYTDAAGNKQAQRTFYKQVTVKVQDKWDNPGIQYLPKPVYLSRVISYKFQKVSASS